MVKTLKTLKIPINFVASFCRVKSVNCLKSSGKVYIMSMIKILISIEKHFQFSKIKEFKTQDFKSKILKISFGVKKLIKI